MDFVAEIRSSGGCFSSVASFESYMDGDLTSARYRIYEVASVTGTVSQGATVDGSINGYTGTVQCLNNSAMSPRYVAIWHDTASEVFANSEQLQVDGSNYITLVETDADKGQIGDCIGKIDGTWGSAETSQWNIDGWTTSADHIIYIYTTTTARHDGKWNTSAHRHQRSSSGSNCINLYEEYITFEGLQISGYGSSGGGSWHNLIEITVPDRSSGANLTKIDACILRKDVATTGQAIKVNSSLDNLILYVFNTAIYDTDEGGVYGGGGGASESNKGYIYNCTISGTPKGIGRGYGLGIWAKNCAVFNNTDDFYTTGGSLYIDYCASDDGDGTNAVDFDGEATAWNANFVDYANKDFHAKAGGDIIGAGTDLSGLYTYDIDGDTRSAWDIGADEYTAGGTGVTVEPASSVARAEALSPGVSTGLSVHSVAAVAIPHAPQPGMATGSNIQAIVALANADLPVPTVFVGTLVDAVSAVAAPKAGIPQILTDQIIAAVNAYARGEAPAPGVGLGSTILSIPAASSARAFDPALITDMVIEAFAGLAGAEGLSPDISTASADTITQAVAAILQAIALKPDITNYEIILGTFALKTPTTSFELKTPKTAFTLKTPVTSFVLNNLN